MIKGKMLPHLTVSLSRKEDAMRVEEVLGKQEAMLRATDKWVAIFFRQRTLNTTVMATTTRDIVPRD